MFAVFLVRRFLFAVLWFRLVSAHFSGTYASMSGDILLRVSPGRNVSRKVAVICLLFLLEISTDGIKGVSGQWYQKGFHDTLEHLVLVVGVLLGNMFCDGVHHGMDGIPYIRCWSWCEFKLPHCQF